MSGIVSLIWVLSYNGYDQQVKDIYEYLKQETVVAFFPHDLGILSNNVDSPDRILWSTLVVEFGDYGTSPRFGWISKTQRAVDCFEQFFAEYGIDECGDNADVRSDKKSDHDGVRVTGEAEKEYLNSIFPHYGDGEWYDVTEMIDKSR